MEDRVLMNVLMVRYFCNIINKKIIIIILLIHSLIQIISVSQVCNEDGMEFTLRTPEGFIGRIYTHGYYDRCFFRGNGGTVNVLRISGAQGYPECGTQRVR